MSEDIFVAETKSHKVRPFQNMLKQRGAMAFSPTHYTQQQASQMVQGTSPQAKQKPLWTVIKVNSSWSLNNVIETCMYVKPNSTLLSYAVQ